MKAARLRTSAKRFGRSMAQHQFSPAERRLIARLRTPAQVQHWRKRVFRTARALATSYYDPYIDLSGCITGYAIVDLRQLATYDWRFAEKNMWAVERFLIDIPHRCMRASQKRIRRMRARYREYLNRTGKKPLY